MSRNGRRYDFFSRDEFVRFRNSVDFFSNRKRYINEALAHIKTEGIWCEFHQAQAAPAKVDIRSDNYRETISFRGFCARQRALNHEVLRHAEIIGDKLVRIFAPEAVTDFALAYRGRFPRFIGSEYSDDPAVRKSLFPIPFQDLHALSFPPKSFDIVVAGDVFEHLPFLDQALRELGRVLRSGGKLIASFPFHAGSDTSTVKAVMRNGKIECLTQPEYHANPVDPNGSLVFEIPGWDILARTRAAGFTSAKMVWHFSQDFGLLARDMLGIIYLVAVK